MKTNSETNNVTKSRIRLIGLIVVFAGPLVLATMLYVLRDNVGLPDATSYGELVSPARPITHLSATELDGKKITVEDFKGSWTLLYLGDTYCDLHCEAGLFKLRQSRLTLGRERSRVQRWYLYRSDQPSQHLTDILVGHTQMRVARLDEPLNDLLQGLPLNGIYIIDPLGNVMMHYDNAATSKGIQKDMKRLLRISRIG